MSKADPQKEVHEFLDLFETALRTDRFYEQIADLPQTRWGREVFKARLREGPIDINRLYRIHRGEIPRYASKSNSRQDSDLQP